MLRKRLMTIVTACAMTMAMCMTSFAAGWKQSATGWWYATNDDGSQWYSNGWQWIDGNGDGTAECYYFDSNGYILANTVTPDGYQVNADGAWVENGIVQTKGKETPNPDVAVDNGGYNEYGVSNTAIEMYNNSREENAKYGEVSVDDWTTYIVVKYANGFSRHYRVSSGSNTLRTVNDDYQKLFKYFDSSISDVKEAEKYLISKGWVHDAWFSNEKSCFVGDIGTLWIKAGESHIKWNTEKHRAWMY